METFDIFALSSSYEGLPYVLLESMAAGLPAVCTRVGGVGLLIAEGVNGFTAPVGDLHAFAAALSTLAGDASLRERMGASARERVSNFSIGRMVESTLHAYAGRLRTEAESISVNRLLPENSLKPVH